MRYLIMQGNFPKTEALPARTSKVEAQLEVERLNNLLRRPFDKWDGSCRDSYWIKEID